MSITNGEGNINSGYAQWELPEFVVAVYFSALGVGAPGVKDLIAHKCNKIVTESAIECQVEHAKSSRPNIYDYAARLWRLGKLGKYLKDIMDDGNFFEYLIQWGTEEEVMVSKWQNTQVGLHSLRYPPDVMNEVVIAYYYPDKY